MAPSITDDVDQTSTSQKMKILWNVDELEVFKVYIILSVNLVEPSTTQG
ncbi:hypothetical protein [Loigolactobacillus backii]|nr:hypothetical protein [Loigolactobacillus backii]MDA5388666.1 hypothetical protein [Loigolactobacillus backii]